ncbi:beta-secretase 1-like [Glandiceps talaboti]
MDLRILSMYLVVQTGFQILCNADMFKIPLRRTRNVVEETAKDTDNTNSNNLSRPEFGTTDEPTLENNLRGKPGQGYYIQIGIGTPQQELNVLVDTGSSNFAVASEPHSFITTYFDRKRSSSFKDKGIEVHVPYTQGRWDGILGTDYVALSTISNATANVHIACITDSDHFFINGSNWEGILGLAYAEIARPDSSITPFFESYHQETNIDDIFTLQLCGNIDFTDTIEMAGTMTVGGIDSSLYTGNISYSSIRKEWYYEIVITDIEVDDLSLGLDCKEYNFDKTIVDSGTTNFRVPVTVFDAIVHSIDDATEVPVTPEFYTGAELMCWAEDQTPWQWFPTVKISLLSEDTNKIYKLVISPKQYMRAVDDGSKSSDDCYKFAITTSSSGSVIGAVIMEGFYVVFDRQNKRVGFAKSTCAEREATYLTPQVQGPFPFDNRTDCAYHRPETNEDTLMAVAYVMASVCALCMIPLLIMLVQCYCKNIHNKSTDSNYLMG